jgi:hypothetical protein
MSVTAVIVTVTTPDRTRGITEAIKYALDNPLNYPDDAGTPEWDVAVRTAHAGSLAAEMRVVSRVPARGREQHGAMGHISWSPAAGIWTAEILWDGDLRLSSVPITQIEPEYTREGE